MSKKYGLQLQPKRIAILLVLALIITSVATPMRSYGGTDTGKYNRGISHVNSVPEEYTGIYDREDLEAIRDNSVTVGNSDYISGKYILMNNIDLSGGAWTPIGKAAKWAFIGQFDGNGYEISGMRVSSAGDGGLFYKIASSRWIEGEIIRPKVENLGLVDSDIYVERDENVVFSSIYIGGVAAINDGIIENCYVTGSMNNNAYQGYFGGIAGMNMGTIKRCWSGVDSIGPGGGGIAGLSSGTVEQSFNTGNV